MEQDLRKLCEELKLYTLQCMNSAQNEDYDALDKLILNRKKVLDNISKNILSSEELKSIVKELDILNKEKMLTDIILKKRVELRDKIDIIEKNKAATNSYNKGTLNSSVIFSKKI